MALAALAFVGSSACSKDAAVAEDGMTTTTVGSETAEGETSEGESSSSTDAGDATTDTSASGGSFYAGPDDSDYSSSTYCDPFMQDCPEGEKCVAYASHGLGLDANKCVPVTGDGAPGDPCVSQGIVSGADDCNESSACWNVTEVDGQLLGTCNAFCSGSPDDPGCPDGTTCLLAYEGSLNLCIESCDPLAQACAEGFGCYWVNSGFFCVVQSQNLAEGEPCGSLNDCAPGQFCAAAELLGRCEGSSCCTGFCSLGNPMCAPEQACIPFFENPFEGYEDVGVCLQP